MRGSAFFYQHTPRLVHLLRRLARANHEREQELLDLLCDRTKTGIDIGAKVGMYTYRIRAHSSDVVAFEPIPLFNHMLRAVFEGKRGRVEPVALSNVAGKATMRLPYDSTGERQFGRSTIETANPLQHHEVATTQQIEVETRTLDGYELANVGFIKIDVEGHELAVLEGAERTIEAQHPTLLVECNDDHNPGAVTRLTAWLRDHDYDAFFIDARELLPIEQYDRNRHWVNREIENFICLHRSRADLKERLAQRVATRRLGSHPADKTAKA